MDYDKLNIIRLYPMSHLATAVRSHPFVAVSAVAVGLMAIFYGYASTTSALFALLLALLIHHTDYMDRQFQQLKDQIKNEVNGYHENTPKSQTPEDSNNIPLSITESEFYNGDINPLANVEQRRSDTFSKQQYLAKDGTAQTSPIGKIAVQAEFVALRCPKEQFRKLKHCCETIDGILTILDQDLADASTFLDEKLISTLTASSVLIFTTEKYKHQFKEASSTKPHLMSITDVVEELQSTHSFALIVLDCHTLTSVIKALKDAKLPSTGTLLVGESDTFQNISGYTLLSTNPDTIVKDADILLERCALAVLKILHSKLLESEQSFSDQKKMSFHDIEDLITTILPRSDRLNTEMQTNEYPSNIDEAIEKLVCLPAIIGCLKKRGTLQIYISQSTNERDQNHIRSVLKKDSIVKYTFVYVTSKNLFSSGDSIFGGRGTLGGFVKKLNLPNVDIKSLRSANRADAGRDAANTAGFTVAALISRHVVQETNEEMLTVGTHKIPIGRIDTLNKSDAVDILPVVVNGVNASECDPCFLTEERVRMFSRLKTSASIHELNGKPVHIWSAGSKPGVGLLVEQDFRTSTGLRVIIRDRRRGEHFAREGDSGAMICYQDPVTEVLYAVAMMVSEVQPQQGVGVRYTAQILDDGLQKLSLINDCQFVLFEENDD